MVARQEDVAPTGFAEPAETGSRESPPNMFEAVGYLARTARAVMSTSWPLANLSTRHSVAAQSGLVGMVLSRHDELYAVAESRQTYESWKSPLEDMLLELGHNLRE